MRLVVLAVILAAAPASAGIRFDAATHGSTLDITFTNTGAAPADVVTQMAAGVANYDWLAVDLKSAAGTRRLEFVTARAAAAEVTRHLAPGAAWTESIDLQWWAVHAGTPIADGAYQVVATWKDKAVSGRVEKTLTIAAPVSWPKTCTPVSGSLQLLAHRSGTQLDVGLHNAGTATMCIQAPSLGCMISDAHLTLDGVELDTNAICDKTGLAPIVELAPGATLWRRVQGKRGKLGYAIVNPPKPGVWAGKLETKVD